MNILAIDTATQVAGVALLNEKKLISEYLIDYKLKHSKKLIHSLNYLLENVEMNYSDIDYFAIAIGPGSFTGLRIGLASVKALAQATQKQIIPVSTLEALAYNISYSSGIVCPLLDARRNQVYSALFKTNNSGKVERLTPDKALSIQDLLIQLKEYNNPVFFLGDGAEKFKNQLLIKENYQIVKSYLRLSQAASIGYYALENIDKAQDYQVIEPSYLRPSYAEEK